MMDEVRTYFLTKKHYIINSLDLEIPSNEKFNAWLQAEQNQSYESFSI